MVTAEARKTYELLKGYLAQDPGNVQLLGDVAIAALQADDSAGAQQQVDQLFAAAGAPAPLISEVGRAALSTGHYALAKRIFSQLREEGETSAVTAYNLAYALSGTGEADAALSLVDEDLAAALPEAAALRVQLLHGRGLFDEAMEAARGFLQLFPESGPLQAAAAVLALDVENEPLAAALAGQIPDRPEGLMTLGTLVLGDGRPAEALDLFDRSVALQRFNPRALIGRGLARLGLGEADAAAEDIDQGAEQFGDHIGSWIAAGWAHYVRGDLAGARSRFERAFAIDPAFAETIGSLSVIDFLEGHAEEARRKSTAALRLDRECFSAWLTQSLIEAGKGNDAAARGVLDQALTMPVGKSGRTMVQFLAKMG